METIKYLWLLAGCFLLLSCGGGSDAPSVAGDEGNNDEAVVPDPQALPNFTVVDFVAEPVLEDKYSPFRYEISIQNTGVGSGRPDLVWELSSARPDFSTGYRFNSSVLERVDNTDERESTSLMPGETGVYTNATKSWLTLGVKGDHYVRIWVNPDKGENFDTSEDRVMSEYEIEESDYSDNFSEVAVINAPNGGTDECLEISDVENIYNIEDVFEENDTLEAATPIDLGMEYETRLCLDHRDIFKIDLEVGIRYEIDVDQPNLSLNSTWVLINPDLSYNMNPNISNNTGITPFKTTQAGTHWLAFYNSPPIAGDLDGSYLFSIRRLP